MVPDIITYSCLISTSVQSQQAHELLKAMQRQGRVPDIVTYSSLISTCKKSQQAEHGYEL